MLITLTTDIGWEYAAEMKGVILSINPMARIIDVSHEIERHNIRQGAFVLYSIAPYFKNAIHVGVIDPTVGTERKAIILKCKSSYFIGPDNGLLIPAAKRMGIEKIYEIEYEKEKVSSVFHGRDVFSPAAAKLSLGMKVGKEINEYVDLDFGKPLYMEGKVIGKILFIDKFGNIVTNIRKEDVKGKKFEIRIGKKEERVELHPSYGYVEEGEILAVIGSAGYLEIAIRNGNAASYFNAKQDDEIEIRKVQE